MAEKGTLDFGIGKEDDREELRDFVREKSEYDDSRDGKRKKFEKDGIGSSRKREKKLKSKSKGRDGLKLKLKKAGDSGERSRDQNGEAEVKEMWDTIARGDSKVNGVGCSGFGWDSNKNMVVAEKQVWDGYVQSHKLLSGKIRVSHIVTCCASSSRKIVLREKMRLLLMMSWRK
ncbi:hypothetical protein CsSME_00050476 [Camellia sinensis var. sinensis]